MSIFPRATARFWAVIVFFSLPFLGLVARPSDADGDREPYRNTRFSSLDALHIPVVDGTTDSYAVVEKQTSPDGVPRQFIFTGDASGELFDDEAFLFGPVPPGSYTSTEIQDPDFPLAFIECSDNDSVGTTGDATAHFELSEGEVVICTFVNVATDDLLFFDTFETGTTTRWSQTVP